MKKETTKAKIVITFSQDEKLDLSINLANQLERLMNHYGYNSFKKEVKHKEIILDMKGEDYRELFKKK